MATEIEIRVGLKSGMADPEGANVQKALRLQGLENIVPGLLYTFPSPRNAPQARMPPLA